MTYSEQLKHPRWQRKRLEIFERDDFTCISCGCKESQLQVHHGVYLKGLKAWEYENKYLHTLCENCHDTTGLFMDSIYKEIGETNPNLLWDLDWVFKWIKSGDAQTLRKWIIETENKPKNGNW